MFKYNDFKTNRKIVLPEVNNEYFGQVVDEVKSGVLVRLNGFQKEFKGILDNKDSAVVPTLITGNFVKVRIISCQQDGFIAITAKNIEQPENEVSKDNAIASEAYQKHKRKIRVASPERKHTNQFTSPDAKVGFEVITEEPDFLKKIANGIPSKVPTKVKIVKNENSFMALLSSRMNENSSVPSFAFKTSNLKDEWADPFDKGFKNMKISDDCAKIKHIVTFAGRNKMSLSEQRQILPIYNYREQIIRAVTDNQFLIVEGETGSGKTTQIPQYLKEAGFILKGKIACTQPRRMAAISVASRVAKEYGCTIGEEVGYKIRFKDVTSPQTVIKYMTDGILLRECLSGSSLEAYSVVILDEAHERTIYTDVLMGLLKKAAIQRPSLRIVISSATMDTKKFSNFFNNAMILSIPGTMFPVEVKYRASNVQNVFNETINTVLNIHLHEPTGDILCFLTGQDEIERAYEIVEQKAKDDTRFENLYPFTLYSAMPLEYQTEIFQPHPASDRKVIFSTNIAETSMTIDGIVYVVDPGYAKQKVYDAKTGIESLKIIPISQASADQRRGRAGRTAPGKCFRLYTEFSYLNEMLPASIPEIQRTNLENVILHLKAIGVSDVLNFDYLDPPPRDCLISALKDLYLLDALDSKGELTKIGSRMCQLPIDPNYAKMLIISEVLMCTDEIITIIAMLSVQNIFHRPRKNSTLADEKKNAFNHDVGDHMRLLNVYNTWEKCYLIPDWCKNNFLNEKKLYEVYEIRKQLLEILDTKKIEVYSAGQNVERIQIAICAGFFKKIAYRQKDLMSIQIVKSYKTLKNNSETAYLHPSSCLFRKLPDWVVYNELRDTTKKYLQDATIINPNWLPIVAKGMYRKISVYNNFDDFMLQLVSDIGDQAAHDLYKSLND